MGIRDIVQPILDGIVIFVTTSVVPAIQDFITFLGAIWTQVQPGLEALGAWFISDGLPAIQAIVTDVWNNVITPFFNFIATAWELISPALVAIAGWFVTDGLPGIRAIVEDVLNNVITPFFNFIAGAWDLIAPVLGDIFDWFVTSGLPKIQEGVGTVQTKISEFVTTLQNIWSSVEPYVNALKDGVLGVLEPILGAIGKVIDGFNSISQMQGLSANAGSAVANSGMNEQQLWDEVLKQSGGNDFAARVAFSQLQGNVTGRATGGDFAANKPVMVGEAGPEVLMPGTSGTVIPNHELSGTKIENLVIYANTKEGGQAAADGFAQRMEELKRRRG
jgi:hypothetical protein